MIAASSPSFCSCYGVVFHIAVWFEYVLHFSSTTDIPLLVEVFALCFCLNGVEPPEKDRGFLVKSLTF